MLFYPTQQVQTMSITRILRLAIITIVLATSARADDGHDAWLRYAPVTNPASYSWLPSTIVCYDHSDLAQSAAKELQRGLSSMLGRSFLVVQTDTPTGNANTITIGLGKLENSGDGDGYTIARYGSSGLGIMGGRTNGELYGVFHLLEEIASQKPIPASESQSPAAPIRWTDEWDNSNGTIERGYAGPSIFFDNGHVRQDLTRAGEYARLLASIGINGSNINNVNADLQILSTDRLKEIARVAEVFDPWGVRLALSIDLTSPQVVGGLDTFDPLDPKVIAWWKQKIDEIYTLIPDFAGFTVKADSEGRKGPSQYGRSPADAANVLARALAPHGGVVLYRGFVYNNHLDWQDPKADRARAGVDNFIKNDGTFEPNVIIQIKEGPIDFQTREPASPLFSALHSTNEAIEVQVAQEYTGQQRHMVWLPSMWKWVLDTDLRIGNKTTPVKSVVEGKAFPLPDGKPRMGGFIAVTNVGLDDNWMHHPMALANLYGFGKLAWNPDASLPAIIDTWTRLTWGNDPQVVATITSLELKSWGVYEGYTGPNGMGTLTNILGYHFGPGIESAEHNGWGQWFRGEKDGVGMDRTAAGTGYAQQYPPELAAKYESLATCPDDLLLFFHHVPYNYKLHSGKTLVQSIYDTHYSAALAAAEYVPQWTALKDKIDPERYQQVLDLFNFQAGHAIVWRDAIDTWFQTASGIPDAQHRVGHAPGRIEAESMQLTGYTPVAVDPVETASGGKAVVCHEAAGCILTTTVKNPGGSYDIAVGYYDTWRGESKYTLSVNGRPVANWTANDTLPPAQFDTHLDGQDATRYTAHNIALKPGDTLTLLGIPDLRPELDTKQDTAAAAGAINPTARIRPDYREYAPVDYIQIGPNGLITPQ